MKQASVCSTDQGGGKRCSGMLNAPLPVDDAEHQLQVLADARSPAAPQLLGYASTAQRAASLNRLVPHALLRLPHPEERLALGEGDPHPLPDRVRVFAREREDVGQDGSMRCSIGFPRRTACQLSG